MNRSAANRMTSVSVSPEVKSRIETLAQDRFGPRGVGFWLEEQLAAVLADRNFLVRCAQVESAPRGVAKSLTLTPRAQASLEEGVRRLMVVDPLRQGARSTVLRAAFQLAFENDDARKKTQAAKAKASDAPVTLPQESLQDIEIPLKVQPPRLARSPRRSGAAKKAPAKKAPVKKAPAKKR